MYKFTGLLKIVFMGEGKRLPLIDYPISQQNELHETIIHIRPLNTLIVQKFPFLKKLKFLLAASIISFFPVIVYLLLTVDMQSLWKKNDLLIAVFLFSFSILGFACVKIGYDELLENLPSFVRMCREPNECIKIMRFVKTAFSTKNQIIFALFFCLFGVVIFSLVGITPTSLKTTVILICWLWCYGVLIGNGLYWAILSPQYVYLMVRINNPLYDTLSPCETPGIRSLSSILGTYALMNTIVVYIVFLSFAEISFPTVSNLGIKLAYFHLIVGGVIVFYSFVYPQVIIVKFIRHLKSTSENNLLEQQEKTLMTENYSFNHLEKILKMLDRLRKSKISPIATRVILKYAISVIIASMAITGRWQPLSKIIEAIGK